MDATDIRSDKSAEMRAQFATVENYMVSLNFLLLDIFSIFHWEKINIRINTFKVVGCMMTVSALIGIIFWGKQRKQQR